MSKDISNSDDILDSRDIFARIEELESDRDNWISDDETRYNDDWIKEFEDEAEELKNLSSFMEEFKGCGGDEQWRGDWYPLILVRDSYWQEYCEQELEELGYIPKDFPCWISIDYEETAETMQVDYSSAEFDGVTYWAR